MKQLLLIRHGKSAWDVPGADDHARPLNDRGERDAPNMAAALRQRGVSPDAILSSTAVRAISTAKLLSQGLGFAESQIVQDDGLYLAPPARIIQSVQQCDESAKTLLVFGHNPGMHEAAIMLTQDPALQTFPTLCVARIEFDVDYWGEVEAGGGLLLETFSPKTLRG